MILGFPRAKQGLCHYDIWGGGPSLIRYSSKTAEQNFMKLSGIVHYIMPYCTSYFKFLFEWFWGFPEQTRTLPYKTWGSGGYHFVSIAHSISSLFLNLDRLCTERHLVDIIKNALINSKLSDQMKSTFWRKYLTLASSRIYKQTTIKYKPDEPNIFKKWPNIEKF